jgi:hypothetical protein
MKNTTKRILTSILAIAMIAVMAVSIASCSGKAVYNFKSTSVKIMLDGRDVTGLYSEMASASAENSKQAYTSATVTVAGDEVTVTDKNGEKTSFKVTKKDGKLVPVAGAMDAVKSLAGLTSVTSSKIDLYLVQEGSNLTMVFTMEITTAGQTVSTVEEIVFTK